MIQTRESVLMNRELGFFQLCHFYKVGGCENLLTQHCYLTCSHSSGRFKAALGSAVSCTSWDFVVVKGKILAVSGLSVFEDAAEIHYMDQNKASNTFKRRLISNLNENLLSFTL